MIELLRCCGENRAKMDAPAWRSHIEHTVRSHIDELQRMSQTDRHAYIYEEGQTLTAADRKCFDRDTDLSHGMQIR